MEGAEPIDWRFLECDGCNRILETGHRLTPPPRYDVPDDRITWNVTPTPQRLMLGCTCGHYTVFAVSATIERWKARRKAQPS
jgi:hypothetical protein